MSRLLMSFVAFPPCFWAHWSSVPVEEGRLCPKGGDPGDLDFLLFSGLIALAHPRGDGILWANHKVSLPVEPGFGAVFGIDPWRQGRGRQILVLDAGFRFEAYCVILAWPG